MAYISGGINERKEETLKETMIISLKKLSVSYYRVYFNGKICDKNKLFNPCDPFFYGNAGKERRGGDRWFLCYHSN